MKDTAIRTYEKLLFTPQHLNEADSKKFYNLFNDFKAELLPDHKDYDSIQPILHHMKKVLCNDDEDHYKWLLQYYANILQNPQIKLILLLYLKELKDVEKVSLLIITLKILLGTNIQYQQLILNDIY